MVHGESGPRGRAGPYRRRTRLAATPSDDHRRGIRRWLAAVRALREQNAHRPGARVSGGDCTPARTARRRSSLPFLGRSVQGRMPARSRRADERFARSRSHPLPGVHRVLRGSHAGRGGAGQSQRSGRAGPDFIGTYRRRPRRVGRTHGAGPVPAGADNHGDLDAGGTAGDTERQDRSLHRQSLRRAHGAGHRRMAGARGARTDRPAIGHVAFRRARRSQTVGERDRQGAGAHHATAAARL